MLRVDLTSALFRFRAVALLSMLVVLACKGAAEQPPPATEAPAAADAPAAPSPSESSPTLAQAANSTTPTPAALMKEHFSKATEMQAAVVRGDLSAFKQAAELLATRQLNGGLAEEWKAHLQGMRSAASAGRDAADIASAAAALGELGRACADCHKALGKKPALEIGSPPAEGSGATMHMERHQWAANRMWEGLMAPSDAAWIKGTEVMADAPLHQEAVAGPKSVSERVGALAKEIHALANRARTAPVDERGKYYGTFLAECASCHTELGVTVK